MLIVIFSNSYEGGRSVPPHMIQNSRLLGANDWQIVLHWWEASEVVGRG